MIKKIVKKKPIKKLTSESDFEQDVKRKNEK
jgi:hypothetical protein